MSARKSWDIQSRPKQAAPKAPAKQVRVPVDMPVPVVRPVPAPRRAAPEPVVQVRRSPAKSAVIPQKGRLADRRKTARRARLKAYAVVFGTLAAVALAATWLSPVRIQAVEVSGPGADLARPIAIAALDGSYAFLVPRDSTFFYPEQEIRSEILAGDPSIAAVSIRRSSLNALSISTSERAAAALWCGESAASSSTCFLTDSEGLLFAEADTASSTAAVPKIYAQLAEGGPPVGSRIEQAYRLRDILKFLRAIEGLGIDVAHVTLAGDEAEIRAEVGTRLVYVIGAEEEAASTAASALPPLDIPSGAYDYVDLRFPGKAYAKRFGE